MVVPDASSSADGLFGYDVDVALGGRNKAWVFSGAPKEGFSIYNQINVDYYKDNNESRSYRYVKNVEG